jgi:hypothetical protein
MRLVVRDAANASTNLSRPGPAKQKTEVLDFDNTLVDISQQATFIEFTPKDKLGKTIGRIRHSDTTDSDPKKHFVSDMFVRVSVHANIAEFWSGNNRATLFKGESNFILSVYAKFDDSGGKFSFGDISSHRYLNFASSDAAFVEVNNTDDKGRLTGKKETTGGPKQVNMTLGPTTHSVDVHVTKALNTPKPLLECIYGSADVTSRNNILIVAEGFTQPQELAFRMAAGLIAKRLMEGLDNSPYHLLKEKFNIWIAFDPSQEDGLSCGIPVNKTSKTPIVPAIPLDPTTAADFRLLQARDTHFGLMNGFRYGDRSSELIDPANPPDRNKWFLPLPVRWPFIDRRRMRKDWNFTPFFNDYLDSLKVDPSRHTGPKFANVSKVWKSNGKDRELVCFLVNSDLSGGFRGRDVFGVKLSVKNDNKYHSLISTGEVLDHAPKLIEPLKVTVPIHGIPVTVIMPVLQGTDIGAVTSTIAHEFAHSLGLADEYEAIEPGMVKVLLETNLEAINATNQANNVTHHWLVKDANDKIDFSKVLWNKWMRVEGSAALMEPAKKIAGNTKIEARIDPNVAGLWLIPPEFKGKKAFLRTRDINFNDEPTKKFIEGPFEIEDIDMKTGKVTLKGTITKTFPKDSVIYVAKERNNTPLSLIEPLVAQFISNSNNGEAFGKKADCSIANRTPTNAPNIPGLAVANKQLVVAVYEGGRTFNCRVYRPCGQCRMRDSRTLTADSFPPFCPVCKYHIVNKIDPSRLFDVDREYPKQEPATP